MKDLNMLTDRDRQILAFERDWTAATGKEAAILEIFGLRKARYYQILRQLTEDREALEAEPVLIHRLQRAQEQKRVLREQRKLR